MESLTKHLYRLCSRPSFWVHRRRGTPLAELVTRRGMLNEPDFRVHETDVWRMLPHELPGSIFYALSVNSLPTINDRLEPALRT